MTKSPRPSRKKMNQKPKLTKNVFFWLGLFLLLLYIVRLGSFSVDQVPKELSYGEFYRLLESNNETQSIESIVKVDDRLHGVFSNGATFSVHIPSQDQELLRL